MQFCSRCGRELAKDAIFCPTCGASVAAPIPTPLSIPSPPIKVSHIKRNIVIVVMLVLLVGIAAAALSTPGPETGTQTTTTPLLQQGNIIRMGQPFILKEGTEKIPVEITFISAWFTTTHEHWEAEKGYKFLVLEIQAKNLGMKKTDCFSTMRWEVTVDKGYIYERKFCNLFMASIRPEETKTGYVFFEILATTTPLEVRYYSSYVGNDPTLVLDMRGETITTTTITASEAQLEILRSCKDVNLQRHITVETHL